MQQHSYLNTVKRFRRNLFGNSKLPEENWRETCLEAKKCSRKNRNQNVTYERETSPEILSCSSVEDRVIKSKDVIDEDDFEISQTSSFKSKESSPDIQDYMETDMESISPVLFQADVCDFTQTENSIRVESPVSEEYLITECTQPALIERKSPILLSNSYFEGENNNNWDVDCTESDSERQQSPIFGTSTYLKTETIEEFSDTDIWEQEKSPIFHSITQGEDENSSFSITSQETIHKTPDTSASISDQSSSNCSSPEKNIKEITLSPTDAISSFTSQELNTEAMALKEKLNPKWKLKTPKKTFINQKSAYSSGKKKRNYMRNGLAEQMEKFSLKERGDQAIWRHQRQRYFVDKGEPMIDLDVKVVSLQKRQATLFVVCENVNTDSTIVIISGLMESLKLESGNVIKIYSPWVTVKSEELGTDVICANFIDVVNKNTVYFPKISKIIVEWSCPCMENSSLRTTDCSLIPTSRKDDQHSVMESFTSRHTDHNAIPLESVIDIVENKEFSLIAGVQRVFHYFQEASKTETWSLLLQDKMGFFCELEFNFLAFEWVTLIQGSAGKMYCFKHLRLLQKVSKNRSANLFSIIHALQKNSGVEKVNYQQFCYILGCDDNVSIREYGKTGEFYVPSNAICLTNLLQNSFERLRYSAIVKVLLIDRDKLYITDDTCTFAHQHNIISVTVSSTVILCSNLSNDCILFLKDFQFNSGKFLMDKYSRVECLTCGNNKFSAKTMNKIQKLKQFSPNLRNLSINSCIEEIIIFEGTILNPDKESSYSWPICNYCGNQILQEIEKNLFCDVCNKSVRNPITRMKLEVFVTCQSLPTTAIIKVKLNQQTTEKILPQNTKDHTYNPKCIINKQIGPIKCLIEHVDPIDDSETQIYNLREI